jgi:hypothetical protein
LLRTEKILEVKGLKLKEKRFDALENWVIIRRTTLRSPGRGNFFVFWVYGFPPVFTAVQSLTFKRLRFKGDLDTIIELEGFCLAAKGFIRVMSVYIRS